MKPPFEGPDESRLVAQDISRQFQGLARDLKVRRANDITEPDDESPTSWSYATGYRASLFLANCPVELRVSIVVNLDDIKDALRFRGAMMPSSSHLTPRQFRQVLRAYGQGSRRRVAIAVVRLDDPVGYEIEGPYKAQGRTWPRNQCYAVAWDIGPEGVDGELNTEAPNDIVWLDPKTGKSKYLGAFIQQ